MVSGMSRKAELLFLGQLTGLEEIRFRGGWAL